MPKVLHLGVKNARALKKNPQRLACKVRRWPQHADTRPSTANAGYCNEQPKCVEKNPFFSSSSQLGTSQTPNPKYSVSNLHHHRHPHHGTKSKRPIACSSTTSCTQEKGEGPIITPVATTTHRACCIILPSPISQLS